MRQVAILQHAAGEGAGNFGMILDRDRVDYGVVHVHDGDPVPDGVDGLTGLVLLGGPMSVNDALPWIPRELALVRAALDAGLPVFGICLGAQIVAAAAGATVGPNPVPEIGWFPVQRPPGGMGVVPPGDVWLDRLPGRFDAFHWHGETFTLPDGAVKILSSEACENQGFVLGSAVALQCHIEMTAAMVREWSLHVPPPSPTVQSAEAMCADLDARINGLAGICEQLVSKWIAAIR